MLEVHMSLELLNTFGTLLTAAIVAATAIAALVQLRHLRAGNQINAMLSIGNQYDDKEFRDARHLMQHKVATALDDPLFREYEFTVSRSLPVPTVPEDFVQLRSAVNLIGNTHEELGILVKNGIVDRDLFLDRYCWVIATGWKRMERYVAYIREVNGDDGIWENFEYLAVLSEDYLVEHPSTYPRGVRRMQPRNPWPMPAMPATA